MHPQVRDGIERQLARLDELLPPNSITSILDIGGQNVNGSLSHVFTGFRCVTTTITWTTLDVAGDVNIVADATDRSTWPPGLEGRRFDLVVSTETLEHVRDWPALVANAALLADRAFIGTCASLGRRAHGATGAYDPEPDEWYENVSPEDLATVLGRYFGRFGVTYEVEPRPVSPTTHDLHWWAIR